jgi:hypothetical protein
MIFCRQCGASIKSNATYCPTCGAPLSATTPPNSCDTIDTILNGRSRIIAVLLAFFLGSFGIHKFYLGSLGWGIIYFLFSWTGIPAIAGVIEAILLLVMDQHTFNQRFN